MKRLTAQIGLVYLSVLSAAYYFSHSFTVVMMIISCVLCVLFFAVSKFRRKIYLPAVALTALVACVVNLSYGYFTVQPIKEQYDNLRCSVSATVIQEPFENYSQMYYKLETEKINGEQKKLNILLSSYDGLDIKAFDTISFTSTLSYTDNSYDNSKGIFLRAESGYGEFDYKVTGSKKPFSYYTVKLRDYMRSALDSRLSPRYSSFCKAILLGDKSLLDTDIKNDFRRAGVSHMIVVSGFHLSVIMSLCLLLFKALFRNRYVCLSLTMLAVLLYMAVTGFSPSIMRSGIMTLIFLFGRVIYRTPYAPNTLGVAALVLTVANPYSVGDIGMLLSFAATYGIIKWSQPLTEFFLCRIKIKLKPPRFLKALLSCISVCLCACVLVTPLSILFFGTFSTVFLLSNILLILPIEAVIVCALFTVVLYYVPIISFLSYPFALISGLLTKFLLFAVSAIADLPFSYVNVGKEYMYIFLLFTLMLVIVMFCYTRGYALVKYLLLSTSLVLIAGCVSSAVIALNTSNLKLCKSGGICAVVNNKSQSAVILFGGENKYINDNVEQICKASGDIAIMSVNTQQSNAKICANDLSGEVAISSVLLYDTDSVSDFFSDDTKLFTLEDSFNMYFDSGAYISFVKAENTRYCYIYSNGKTALLIGDCDDAQSIAKAHRSSDIIELSQCMNNQTLLSCDTLVIDADETKSAIVAHHMLGTYNAVSFLNDGDITLNMEV